MDQACVGHLDVSRRIGCIEEDVKELKIAVQNIKLENKNFDTIELKIDNVEEGFKSLKKELTQIVSANTEKTWQLIYKGVKIIIALVVCIIVLSGVKLTPEILKLLS